MNQLDFNGRHAVVTGGATGLGFGIAKRLLASGGSVTVWDRDGEAATKAAWALGARAYALTVDVTQQPSVAKAVAATLAQAGRIDALVNSAGITGPNTRLWDYPVDAWRQVGEKFASEQPGAIDADIEIPASFVLVWLMELGPDEVCTENNPFRGRLGEISFTP